MYIINRGVCVHVEIGKLLSEQAQHGPNRLNKLKAESASRV